MAMPPQPPGPGPSRPGAGPAPAGRLGEDAAVRADGGVVGDLDDAGVTRFAVVHRPRHDERPADAEVDDVQWWTATGAALRLTHRHDRDLLARVLAAVPATDPVADPGPGTAPDRAGSAGALTPVTPGPEGGPTRPA